MASLSRVVEPRRPAERPIAHGGVTQRPVDQVAVAQAMSRQAAALHTSVMDPPPAGQVPTEHWYRREDPYITAETDAAFAAFMAGDNPHLRTDEVPVVDFTGMIEKVGPDGRPVNRSSRQGSRIKLGLVALATTAALTVAVAVGFISLPGTERIAPDTSRATISAPTGDESGEVVGETVDAQPTQSVDTAEVLSSTPADGSMADADGEEPLLDITPGDD